MKNLILQAVKFIGLSGIGWILDFGVYAVLVSVSSKLMLNNIISSWAGVTFVFVFATRNVFKNKSRIPLKWKYVIYILYQMILILVISKALNAVDMIIMNNTNNEMILKLSPAISKILITPVTMILNFGVMKGVMEKI